MQIEVNKRQTYEFYKTNQDKTKQHKSFRLTAVGLPTATASFSDDLCLFTSASLATTWSTNMPSTTTIKMA